jgi:hypothetical protein
VWFGGNGLDLVVKAHTCAILGWTVASKCLDESESRSGVDFVDCVVAFLGETLSKQ